MPSRPAPRQRDHDGGWSEDHRLAGCGPDRRGLYNLASFNATIGEIGERVAAHLCVPLERTPDTFTYDFSIATEKFQEVYDFAFTETVETIVEGLQAGSPRYRARRERCPEAPYGQ